MSSARRRVLPSAGLRAKYERRGCEPTRHVRVRDQDRARHCDARWTGACSATSTLTAGPWPEQVAMSTLRLRVGAGHLGQRLDEERPGPAAREGRGRGAQLEPRHRPTWRRTPGQRAEGESNVTNPPVPDRGNGLGRGDGHWGNGGFGGVDALGRGAQKERYARGSRMGTHICKPGHTGLCACVFVQRSPV